MTRERRSRRVAGAEGRRRRFQKGREKRDVLEFVRILLEGTPRAFLEESNAPRPLIRDDRRNIRVSLRETDGL